MRGFVTVFLGAGLGGALRHGVNILAAKLLGSSFPFGTLIVNIVGSLLMGALIEWFALRYDPGQWWRLFLTTGILGGFTTFSAFSIDAALMVERHAHAMAAAYVLISVLGSLAGLFIGLLSIRHLT